MVDIVNASGMSMSNMSFDRYWLESPEFRLHWLIKVYSTPTFIIAGSIGNMTVAAILYRHQLTWQHSICFYMFVYALLNTLVLNLAFGLNWLPFVVRVRHVMEIADWMCRVYQLIFRIITYFPAWIIVAMMVDRVVSPSSSLRHVCTIFVAELVTVFIFIGLVAISIHAMWMYELMNGECYILEPPNFMTIVWPWIAATFYSYIPFVALLTLNVLLCLRWHHIVVSYSVKQHQFTRATLLVSVSYILCNFPILLVNFIDRAQPSWLHAWHNFVRFLVVHEVCQLIGCLHHAITFVIYFSTMSLFRCSLKCHKDTTRQTRDSVTDLEMRALDTSENHQNDL
ncbi:hypothetical protein NP493_447g05034 [Ridgeia piscesae]|uniref:G-protein coupled receptors family 1 profile domain-containing protein n=1 Tax=Ridgeia piscesae TaxID=27915 RepID=A0AAD9KZP4_RIDPI|nr:hypothetical protein NP493_447g05034 [Ridgeia piscesae]